MSELLDGAPRPRLTSLRARRAPLADPRTQLAHLDAVPLSLPSFNAALAAAGCEPLRTTDVEVLQLHLGKLCNLTCRHCHVDAGPDRTERMSRATLEAALDLLDATGAGTLDLTGGAPELHPDFRWLIDEAVGRGVRVIDRCNLTVLLLARHADLPAWLAERGVEVVASLPNPRAANTDAQRGEGTFEGSIEALRRLNAAGYGRGDPRRVLTLVHNPAGAFLPGGQASMERSWKQQLAREHGVAFDRLFTITNMPIARFLEWLASTGNTEAYLRRLVDAFNPAAVAGLMCRTTLSVACDGTLHDCDFNQVLDLPADLPRPRLGEVDVSALRGRRVRTARHCFGCTAGAGSSCGGATAPG